MSYTYTKVDDLEKTTMVGNHQCVALVRHYAGAPCHVGLEAGGGGAGKSLAAQRHGHCHVHQP